MVQIERFVPAGRGGVGRPARERAALARAFVANAVLGLPTTVALMERLHVDGCLRRLCGFDGRRKLPGAWLFSRAFAELAEQGLVSEAHAALIKAQLGDQLIGHIARDATEIQAREKPAKPQPAARRSGGERPQLVQRRPGPRRDSVLTHEEWQVLWLTRERRPLPAVHRPSVGPVWRWPNWAVLRIPNARGAPVGTPSGMDGRACSSTSRTTGSSTKWLHKCDQETGLCRGYSPFLDSHGAFAPACLHPSPGIMPR